MTQGPCDYRLFFFLNEKRKQINEKSRSNEQLTEPKLGTKMLSVLPSKKKKKLSVQVQLCTAIN